MKAVIENQLIELLTSNFVRSPKQINGVQQSDSEIIDLSTFYGSKLAVTTDSIVEEILLGLYDDPYLIGWMIVMINMSDLAAVGAKPIGILISEIIPENLPKSDILKLQQGINDACCKCETYVLGGDTNTGTNLILTGCALGIIQGKNPNFRTACQVNDSLYCSGYLGQGNAYALTKMLLDGQIDFVYRPIAKLSLGNALCDYANCCMDTSDGLISTLDQLMRLNNVGFKLENDWEECLDPASRFISNKLNIPSWLLLAGNHGEFELVFTIPQEKEELFLNMANKNNVNPIKIGSVTENIELVMPFNNKLIPIDTGIIRNLSYASNSDVHKYIDDLLKLDRQLQNT